MRSKALNLVGSAVFFLMAPCVVAGALPWWISRWRLDPPFLGLEALRWLGIMAIAIGLWMMLDAFARFALQGMGTPAPPLPTHRLVVTGPYRYVRNPMYVALLLAIFGQSLLFGNVWLAAYGLLVFSACHVFVTQYEEPRLRRAFGPAYDDMCRNVPRWMPRLRPWSPSPDV